jgi:HPt (histidine-containing phosphotransfer) domain-containing protein
MTSPFDRACMVELWGLPPDEIFAEVISLVRAEMPRLCAAAAASLAAGRRADLQRAAHTLKGATGNVCAARLTWLAEGLAEAALTEAPPALAARLAEIVHECQSVAAVIDAGGPYG